MLRRMAVLTTVVLLVSTSCASTQDRITNAPERVREAGSARMEMRFVTTITAPEGTPGLPTGGPIEFKGSANGIIDFANERASISYEFEGPEGAAVYEGLDVCQIVIDGDRVLMAVPPDKADGKSWLPLEGGSLADAGLQGFGAADPSGALEFLVGVSGEIEEKGEETVAGQRTTHYSGTVDVSELLEKSSEERRSQLRAQFGTDVEELPLEVWLDEEGHPIRMVVDLGTTGGAGTATLTQQLTEIGEPVDVEVPSESEIGEPRPATEVSSLCFGFERPEPPAEGEGAEGGEPPAEGEETPPE